MATAVAKTCGAIARTGKPCRRPAGWGTDHVGYGCCKLHLGSTKKHSRGAAREEALTFARGVLGQELDVDPLEGVLMAVRLSYGIVDHWRHRLQNQNGDPVTDDTRDQYARAVMDYTRICKLAIDAGVAERQIKIMERMAEQLSMLFEDLVAAAQATVVQRERMMRAWVEGLARLEQPVIEGTAEELAA